MKKTLLQEFTYPRLLILLVIVIALVSLGIIIGFFIGKGKGAKTSDTAQPTTQPTVKPSTGGLSTEDIKDVTNKIEAGKIKENLRYLTEYPHPAGRQVSKDQADHLKKLWTEQGLDQVDIHKYNILLSYPNNPGQITIFDDGTEIKKLVIDNEPAIDDTEKKGEVLYPFNAFSPKATVTGEYVYINYGRDSDFEAVEKLGINVKGKIAFMRYGKTARGAKVERAQVRGCLGVILYSDLSDTTIPGKEYPNGWMANKDAIQRGTINRLAGDALSLGRPAKDNYFRIDQSKEDKLPKIPSQPISFTQAYHIFSAMQDDSIALPDGWQGSHNVSAKLQSGKKVTITLNVDTKLETRPTYTVCGKLYGRTEKDRYVVFGNHRDAWTYGAADPSSGSACLMEAVRVMGAKTKSGWRPRRSLMFCSWDAEEPGTLGSTEWADDHHKFIMDQVVAYLNIDMAVEGNFTVRLKVIDIMEDGVFDAAKEMPAPDDASKSLYQDWLEKSALLDKKSLAETKKPKTYTPIAGSDYKCFWHTYGTSILDTRYLFSKVDYPFLSTNGHYHTRYESFGWMSKYVDPDFLYHKTITKLWLSHGLRMADSSLIPLNVLKYCLQLKSFFDKFETAHTKYLQPQNIKLDFMKERIDVLVEEAKKFVKAVEEKKDKLNALELRAVNDIIMQFERNFLSNQMNIHTSARNVVYSSPQKTLEPSQKFPGIQHAMYFAQNGLVKDWDEVKKQITLVVWCIDTAIRSLSDQTAVM